MLLRWSRSPGRPMMLSSAYSRHGVLCQMWLPDVQIHPIALSLAQGLCFGCRQVGNGGRREESG